MTYCNGHKQPYQRQVTWDTLLLSNFQEHILASCKNMSIYESKISIKHCSWALYFCQRPTFESRPMVWKALPYPLNFISYEAKMQCSHTLLSLKCVRLCRARLARFFLVVKTLKLSLELKYFDQPRKSTTCSRLFPHNLGVFADE